MEGVQQEDEDRNQARPSTTATLLSFSPHLLLLLLQLLLLSAHANIWTACLPAAALLSAGLWMHAVPSSPFYSASRSTG
jgi:hypothetical protein